MMPPKRECSRPKYCKSVTAEALCWASVASALPLGDSWTPAATGLPSNPTVSSFLRSGAALFATGSPYSYQSTDGGVQWTTIGGLPRETMLSLCDHNGTLLIGTINNGVYRSTDGGSSWVASNGGLRARDMQSLFTDGSTLYANGQGVQRALQAGWSAGVPA